MANATKLANDMRADCLKMRSYADSLFANLIDGGSAVANREKRNKKKIIISPERIMLCVLSGPYTSDITSFIENIRGIRKSDTLALSLIKDVLKSGNVFPPITSAETIQNIYKEIRKSTLLIEDIFNFIGKINKLLKKKGFVAIFSHQASAM